MWLKLEHLHEYITGRQMASAEAASQPHYRSFMFVVKAFDVHPRHGAMPYTTDAYCTWLDVMGDLEWVSHASMFPRWPHAFKPTHLRAIASKAGRFSGQHFALLPEQKE